MPFMAITAHWIDHVESASESHGPRNSINLRSELIAFHCVPSRHTGEHLATVFMNIINRYKIKNVRY